MADLKIAELTQSYLKSQVLARSKVQGYEDVSVNVYNMVDRVLVDDANPDKYAYHEREVDKFERTAASVTAEMEQLKSAVLPF